MIKKSMIITMIALFASFMIISGCNKKVEPVKIGSIPDNEMDPAEWGKVYPLEYESWLKTKDPKPVGKTRYKRGWDEDKIMYDKLSQSPFLALLFNGWAFGIEYNEPRGHYYAVIDQVEIDPARVGAGGVCLACKSPYFKGRAEKEGLKFLKMPFMEAVNSLPEKTRMLAVACADCHDNKTMGLRTNRQHIDDGLKLIGKKDFTRQEMRTVVCGQCHITYYVPRDENMKTNGNVALPWTNSKFGNISIENIIKDLMTDYKRLEWKHKVTGYKMPFIRHPEFELFTKNSTHWNAGAACADCHMPYQRVGSYKISDHDVTSPLKNDLKSCAQCHTESADWLKKQVMAIQDRTMSIMIRAGYQSAVTAKLIEFVHAEQSKGKQVDMAMYNRAKDAFMQGFLRLNFISAENSTGFHNPTETARILTDSVAYSSKSEAYLRQMLAKAGIDVPQSVNLELSKYLNGRGKRKLNFRPEQEFRDPFDMQEFFTPGASKGI